jgi:hypothetical protein
MFLYTMLSALLGVNAEAQSRADVYQNSLYARWGGDVCFQAWALTNLVEFSLTTFYRSTILVESPPLPIFRARNVSSSHTSTGISP